MVKYRIYGFSKFVELSVDKHKQLCITLLVKNEQELEAARVMKKGVVGVVGANAHGCLGSTPWVSRLGQRKGIATFVFFFFFFNFINKQEYVDLFEYLTNPLGMCSPPIPYILGYYRKESHWSGPKMLARGFEPKIS